ncbi:MAG: hypothetical protein LQ342_008086 [Letrouitia transgressa]|nr:MAG: hypothetical protein LQ342_008086 [Letrouitia transgressa]
MRCIESGLGGNDNTATLGRVDFEDILQTFCVHGNRFAALRPAQAIRTEHDRPGSFATVIRLEGQVKITREWLQQAIETYQSSDDVFCGTFLGGVIFTRTWGSDNVEILPGAVRLLQSRGTLWTKILRVGSGGNVPLPGPYLASGGDLFETVRLYDDTHNAFLCAIVLRAPYPAKKVCVGGDYIQTIKIAAPSGLRGLPTQKKPLAGLRVAVKDIFQIRGIRTSLCNRSYYELYPPATETAECIELLTQMGANIVGTTKLASFAATEEPLECVDFGAPWNPRADGYQSPAGSSSGSGAVIASYSWLDIAIGSDSKRSPSCFEAHRLNCVLQPVALHDGPAIGMAAMQCGHHMAYFPSMAIYQASGDSMFQPFLGGISENARLLPTNGMERSLLGTLK